MHPTHTHTHTHTPSALPTIRAFAVGHRDISLPVSLRLRPPTIQFIRENQRGAVLDRKIKHLISQKVTVVKVKNLNFPPKMKSFALILSLSAAAVVAAPQYSVNNNNNNRPSRPSPQTQCRVIKDIEYREEFETKCQTIYE